MDNFWSKANTGQPHECWAWTGAPDSDGYGVFQGSKAHRIALSLVQECPNPKLKALHSCDNPICVNPHHLRWGTQAENIKDAVSRNRMARAKAHGKGKLSDEDIPKIKKLYSTQRLTQGQIAEVFEVGQQHISDIVRGKRRADS